MKTMLVSVGGAETPIIHSIRNHFPDKIIFFVSRSSRTQISEKIMPAIFAEIKKMIDHEFVVTPDEQDIGASTEALLNEVPKAMRKLDCDAIWPDIVVFDAQLIERQGYPDLVVQSEGNVYRLRTVPKRRV